jgi:hypothetical protein
MSPYLLLPIYRCPEEVYWAASEKRQARFRRQFGEDHPYLKERLAALQWPPWLVNDLLGFLAIDDDAGDGLLGIVYLKLRFLPRHLKQEQGDSVGCLPPPSQHMVPFAILPKQWVDDTANNASFIAAAKQIVAEAEEQVRGEIRYGRRASVWMGIDLSCIDFARAYHQARSLDPDE